MAITRAQIARQLLAEGGVSLDDAKMMAPPGDRDWETQSLASEYLF